MERRYFRVEHCEIAAFKKGICVPECMERNSMRKIYKENAGCSHEQEELTFLRATRKLGTIDDVIMEFIYEYGTQFPEIPPQATVFVSCSHIKSDSQFPVMEVSVYVAHGLDEDFDSLFPGCDANVSITFYVSYVGKEYFGIKLNTTWEKFKRNYDPFADPASGEITNILKEMEENDK